jgi:hypothetical protein
MNFSKPLRCFLAAAAVCAAANAATVFTFDSDSLGTATGFTDKVNGISATFSSPGDPGGFVVYQSMFDTLTGNVLGDPGPAGKDGLSLTVAFSINLSYVALDFATADFFSASPLTLTAYENSKLIGSTTATGTVPGGYTFPEGVISFAGKPFDQIVISSTAMDLAVDNISVVAAPEPAVCALFGAGLLVLGLAGRLRTQRN